MRNLQELQQQQYVQKQVKRQQLDVKTTYTEYFLWFTAPGTCDKHSGSELQSNTTTDTNKNVTEIIKGITNEIDEKNLHEQQNQLTLQ